MGALSMALSVVSYFPHLIHYLNELTWHRLRAHRLLADSNLDSWQGKDISSDTSSSTPQAVVEPAGPQAGTLVVSVNRLTAVLGVPERYAWMRDNFEPAGHVAYAYLIYQVLPEELEAIERRSSAASSGLQIGRLEGSILD